MTEDLNSSSNGIPKVGRFPLADKNLFPDNNILIDPMPDRQKWDKGRTIIMMWPTKDARGKVDYKVTRTKIFGICKQLCDYMIV